GIGDEIDQRPASGIENFLNGIAGAVAVDVGALMLAYGGGGHVNAGTCQVGAEEAEDVIAEITAMLSETPAAG
ncbi:MAG: hypothetical protein N3A57_06440, partial [Negativicutes bacterium]|nr:hypothetical protein [Negativicutes bacterium]